MPKIRSAWAPLSALIPLAVAIPLATGMAQGRDKTFQVYGLQLDGEAFKDSLALPFWGALAATPCATIDWTPDVSSESAFRISIGPLRKRLVDAVGALQPQAGTVLQRVSIYRGARFNIERVLLSSRIPGSTTFGYVVRQKQSARKTAAMVLVHGPGMQPLEAFGWDVSDSYHHGERAKHASFVSSALEFAEAGYTVYIPWLADNSQSTNFDVFPWATLERNGAALRPRVRGLGPLNLVVNEIAAGADFLLALPDVDNSRLAILGWGDGSQIAAMTAAVDSRFSAVVRLSAPLDRRAFRGSTQGVIGDAHFTHVDCALGDKEMAALIAPRPLYYSYSTKDESVSRTAQFVSLSVSTGIREIYQGLRRAESVQIHADTAWSPANSRRVRAWVDAALDFMPRPAPQTITIGPAATTSSVAAWIESTRNGRQQYATTLGTCLARAPLPDLTSVPDYLRSVEPFRRDVARTLGVDMPSSGGLTVLRRTVVARLPAYSLEFIQLLSTRSASIISGMLAMPTLNANERLPAMVSADGDAGLGVPFGLSGREPVPYLNAYADAMASSGTIVFVPYYPFAFPEIAAAEAAARTRGTRSSFSYIIPIMSAAADFLFSLPEVDSSRVGIWGISFAGVAALYGAALDTRFSSVVFSDPVVTADVLFGTQTSSSLAAWWPEICSTVDAVQTYLIAPRRFVRENGLRDANGYERSSLESVNRIRDLYNALGLSSRFTLVRHSGGHETRPSSVKAVFP